MAVYHRDSKFLFTMGGIASALGGALLAEGDERGVGATFCGLAATCGFGFADDLFGSSHLGLSARKLLITRNLYDRSKASAVSVAIGASLVGIKNVFSGIYHRDLRQVGKGSLQYVVAGMGLYATTRMPSSVAAMISYAAMASYHTLCRGIKGFANGQKLGGAASIFMGASGVLGTCGMAYAALQPVSSISQVIQRT